MLIVAMDVKIRFSSELQSLSYMLQIGKPSFIRCIPIYKNVLGSAKEITTGPLITGACYILKYNLDICLWNTVLITGV